jgi:hypothetical protein
MTFRSIHLKLRLVTHGVAARLGTVGADRHVRAVGRDERLEMAVAARERRDARPRPARAVPSDEAILPGPRLLSDGEVELAIVGRGAMNVEVCDGAGRG